MMAALNTRICRILMLTTAAAGLAGCSNDPTADLMEYAEVAIAPGRAFGEGGEGYMRIALVENEQRLRQAIRNIARYVRKDL